MIENGLKHIRQVVSEYRPEYNFSISSALTLVVENLFSRMRAGSDDTPLTLVFAQRFSAACREFLKQKCRLPFHYFTSRHNPFYQSYTPTVEYKSFPDMPQPKKETLAKEQHKEMQRWGQDYGQSVRQTSVRNMSTKDKPGTLP